MRHPLLVVHRAKTGPTAGGAIEHSPITEVYHVMEGNRALVKFPIEFKNVKLREIRH